MKFVLRMAVRETRVVVAAAAVLLHLHRRRRRGDRGAAIGHPERARGVRRGGPRAHRRRRAHLDQPRLDAGGAGGHRPPAVGGRGDRRDRYDRDADHGAAGGRQRAVAHGGAARGAGRLSRCTARSGSQGGQVVLARAAREPGRAGQAGAPDGARRRRSATDWSSGRPRSRFAASLRTSRAVELETSAWDRA